MKHRTLLLIILFSFIMADILIRKPSTTPNPLIADPANAALKAGVLTPLGLATSTYNYLLTETKLEGDGTGFGFNFGLKYNLTECLALGLSGIYYNDISLDGKVSATTYFAKIDDAKFAQLQGTLSAMVQGNLITAAQMQQILGVYSGQTQVKYDNDKGDATLPLPMTLGAGLAFTGVKNLLLSADVSWTQWSAWDVIKIDMEEPNKDSELVENLEYGIRIGLGAEYQM